MGGGHRSIGKDVGMFRCSVIFVATISALLMAPATVSAQNPRVPLSELLPRWHQAQTIAEDQAFVQLFGTPLNVTDERQLQLARLALPYPIRQLLAVGHASVSLAC